MVKQLSQEEKRLKGSDSCSGPLLQQKWRRCADCVCRRFIHSNKPIKSVLSYTFHMHTVIYSAVLIVGISAAEVLYFHSIIHTAAFNSTHSSYNSCFINTQAVSITSFSKYCYTISVLATFPGVICCRDSRLGGWMCIQIAAIKVNGPVNAGQVSQLVIKQESASVQTVR